MNLALRISTIAITVIVLGLVAFFSIQLAVKDGAFRQPGEIIFDASVSELGHDFGTSNLEGIELASNVTISATNSFTKLADDTKHALYDVLVPVTDFYSGQISITAAEAESSDLVSIWNLQPTQKLLAIDNDYYLDTFDSGAIFQYYVLDGEAEDIEKVHSQLSQSIAAFPSSNTVFTFAQTGVTALSRGMNLTLNKYGAAHFTEKIGDFLSSFDKTHTSNESSFSVNAPTGSHVSSICSYPGMLDVLTGIGIDIIELTGNHNQDCGDQAAIDTIDQYNSLGIEIVGGGKTAAEAAIPLEISEKGTHITMLGYNLSTGGYTLDNTPGANFYTEEKARTDIAAAKERGDFVIVDVQYYECNAYASTYEDTTCDYANSAAGDQIGFFRSLIDMGADIVVGTSAHQPQTFELYGNGAIYYGLGNLFFDQSWWPGTTHSLILVHYFYNNALLQTKIVPTVYDKTFQTEIMDNAAAATFIERLVKARPENK